MRAKLLGIALVSVLMLSAVVSASAQSLADVARQAQERRKTVTQSSKTLTDKDLGTVPPVSPAPPTLLSPESESPAPEAGAAGTDADGTDTDGADGTDKDTSEADGAKKTDGAGSSAAEGTEKDQAYWSGRAKDLQEQMARNQTFAVALQSRINALANEYTNQADPLQQASIATERQTAVAELDRVNKQIADDKKALADLQEEARRAGVPSGWLR
jgi:hypothetical protein